MNDLQTKLREAEQRENPLDQVIKTMLKSQAKSCVLAKKKLIEIDQDSKKA